MAKLPETKAKAADASTDGGFDPLPDGAYHVRLREVDSTREGPSGPYWSWEFEVVEEGEFSKRRLWTNTSLSDQALWKLKETFDAFGVPTDTDTDELLGKIVLAVVTQRTIQAGARKGELSNNVDKLRPPRDDFDVAAVSASPEVEDIFS